MQLRIMSNFVGPQLPPNFKKESEDSESTEGDNGSESPSDATPLSSSSYFGPALPPNFRKCGDDDSASPQVSSMPAMIGPALPPGLKKTPTLGSCEVDDDEDDTYGPVPEGSESAKQSRVQNLLEIQAKKMRLELASKRLEGESCKNPSRETWMLELPSASSVALGLGPRSFKTKEGPDMSDRSSWTDTPEDKLRKERLGQVGAEQKPLDPKEESEQRAIEAKQKLMEEQLRKLKKKRKEKSLLDEHQEKLRKKRKKDKKKRKGEPEERRPFSREVDLQVNRFDEAKRKAVIKKAGLLDDRFSSGKSKFL